MRIAPELFLKELVIGGLGSGVFEISKVFRNEGIDATHNPEFTTIEVYKPFANYHYMREMTETLFREIVRKVNGGSLQVRITKQKKVEEGTAAAATSSTSSDATSSNSASTTDVSATTATSSVEEELIIDFSQPFRTIDIMSTLQAKLNRDSPLPDPNNEASLAEYLQICKNNNVEVKAPITLPRVLGKSINSCNFHQY